MRTFAIVNRKGGVGKTTTAVNLAYILATSCKKRVLLIDADSQGNASSILTQPNENGVSALLRYGGTDFYSDHIDQTDVPGLDLMPAGEDLDTLDLECMIGKQQPNTWVLRGFLDALEEDDAYDVTVIDCPPYFSLSCMNAITAANRLIIPTGTDAYSTVGMSGLVRKIDQIREACPGVSVAGCLVTQWTRSGQSEDAVSYLREEGPIHIFRTVIRSSIEKVREATWARQATAQWSPFCNTSRDYRAWVKELLDWEGMSNGE